MSLALLDVNVLIALIDPTHQHHDAAHAWFFDCRDGGWATCSTTENGVIRIVSHPRYSNSQPVATVMDSLDTLVAVPGHRRITEDVTLLSADVDRSRMLSSTQVTDTYLLYLAHANRAQLATFDRRLSTAALPQATDAILQIPD
ncbi:TA system VapC family ribonuclease toxin [Microbacterium sp.]|uniref:TA system VapC family ribonuclease toxin n=1 Tax=Microbacterium sp. TaxID=51671 RepID=UPI003A8DAE97